MKQSKHSDSQIMAVAKPAEAGTPVPEMCPKLSDFLISGDPDKVAWMPL